MQAGEESYSSDQLHTDLFQLSLVADWIPSPPLIDSRQISSEIAPRPPRNDRMFELLSATILLKNYEVSDLLPVDSAVPKRKSNQSGKAKCSVCHGLFASKSNLAIHFRIHTGEKPYPCEHCSKRFTTKGARSEHHRIHTGEKPFVCQLCSYAFAQRSGLYHHLKKNHCLSNPTAIMKKQ